MYDLYTNTGQQQLTTNCNLIIEYNSIYDDWIFNFNISKGL